MVLVAAEKFLSTPAARKYPLKASTLPCVLAKSWLSASLGVIAPSGSSALRKVPTTAVSAFSAGTAATSAFSACIESVPFFEVITIYVMPCERVLTSVVFPAIPVSEWLSMRRAATPSGTEAAKGMVSNAHLATLASAVRVALVALNGATGAKSKPVASSSCWHTPCLTTFLPSALESSAT